MSAALAGRRVLVTRPAGQAGALLEAIAEAGATALHRPLLAIEPLDAEQDAERLQQARQRVLALDGYRRVIFISGNAVSYGLELIETYWPQLPVDIEWYGIGAGTCRQLRQHQVPVADPVECGAMNSEALLQRPELQQLADERVLIVRGVGGRETLAATLRQRGAEVAYLECYHRVAAPAPVGGIGQWLVAQDIDTVCLSSGEGLQNFSDWLAQDAGERPEVAARLRRQLRLVVPGDRVAELAKQWGFSQVQPADNASDAAMLAALQQSVAPS